MNRAMKSLEEIARETAEKIRTDNNPYWQDGSYKDEVTISTILTALETAQDEFIDDLFAALKERGIDPSNWDGDEPAHVLIADGIASALETAVREQLEACKAERKAQLEFTKSIILQRNKLKSELEEARKDKEIK